MTSRVKALSSVEGPVQSLRPPRISGQRALTLAGAGSISPGKTPRLEGLVPSQSRGASSRVRDVDTGAANDRAQEKAKVHIEVNIQSINFSKTIDQTADDVAKTSLYVTTLMHFGQLVAENFANVLTEAKRGLCEDYGCESVQLRKQPCGLLLDVTMARRKLVGFQCDQSSGQLARDLERWLVSRKMTRRLDVSEIKLSTEVASRAAEFRF